MKGRDMIPAFTFCTLDCCATVLGHVTSGRTASKTDTIVLEEGLTLLNGFIAKPSAALEGMWLFMNRALPFHITGLLSHAVLASFPL